MSFRFRFTFILLAVGAIVLAVGALIITRSARSNEEANLVADISSQSSQNADLISGVLTTYTGADDGGNLIGAPVDSAASVDFANLVMSTLVQSSDIVRLSLFDTNGALLWSSVENGPASIDPGSDTFTEALSGEVATGLSRSVDYVSPEGEPTQGSVTSTYIPLVDHSTESTTQVLEVAREVSSVLDTRIANTRSSMMWTLLGTFGSSFVVLTGIAFAADTVINRSRRRALAQDEAIAESRVEAERLEMRNHQLEEWNREHDRFLSMVSHELRTPLTTMLAFTEVLKKRQGGENRDANLDHLALMRRNGDHLNSLIAEMLEVAEINSAEFQIDKESFGLRGLAEQIKAPAESILNTKGQRLRMSSPDVETPLFADRMRVTQLMMNLISNASAYSPANTTVTVDLESSGDLVKLSVTDQGEGVSEEDQKRLFDPFFRGNSEFARGQSGLGLGLAIVKAIVDAHDGRISVRSQPGSGTSVTVLIPASEDAEHEQAA